MSQGKKLKVLYLPRWYPHRYDPMPGLFIERHARAVAGLVDVAVLFVHQDDRLKDLKADTQLFRDHEIVECKIYYKPYKCIFPAIGSLVNLYRFLLYHSKGFKILKREFGTPDLIHVNVLTRLGVIALLYKWISGTPYVITEHWTRYLPQMDNYQGFLRKLATRIVVRHASAVMPVTDNLRKAMERHGLHNRNYRVIPNVVDISMFRRIEAKKEVENPSSFIHVSCFEDKQKNISGILRVLKKLSLMRTDWICHMVGEGIHLERLVRYARELEIDDRLVKFHGLKENEELSRLMAGARFQVLFSRFENLPVVILESLACGVPVLSTDVGGISEHLHSGLGLLISSEDENALLENIIYMLDHSEEYDKEKIRKYAEDHFSRDVIGTQLAAAYFSICNNC
jgi:glycosyltransferase involved in cell wall biosynthesis